MPPRLGYYLANLRRLATPRALLEQSRAELEREIDRLGREALERRLDLICRFPERFALPADAAAPGLGLLGAQRNYAFDLLEHTRALPRSLRYRWRFGDETSDPGAPTLVKARRIGEPSGHSVVFPLNKVRHYFRVPDRRSFRDKRDSAIWRGKALRPWRQQFLRSNFDKRGVDVGCIDERPENAPYRKPYASFDEQLSHKFVLSIEGNDVATNLKWIMASQSLCLMVPPSVESWFLESELIPGVHYVALRPDYADLEEQIDRYARDVPAAERILAAAQARVRPFFEARRERVLARAVLWRYARASGQLPD
jgi:hypothetical protein